MKSSSSLNSLRNSSFCRIRATLSLSLTSTQGWLQHLPLSSVFMKSSSSLNSLRNSSFCRIRATLSLSLSLTSTQGWLQHLPLSRVFMKSSSSLNSLRNSSFCRIRATLSSSNICAASEFPVSDERRISFSSILRRISAEVMLWRRNVWNVILIWAIFSVIFPKYICSQDLCQMGFRPQFVPFKNLVRIFLKYQFQTHACEILASVYYTF